MTVAKESGKLLAHRLKHRIDNVKDEDQILKEYSMDYSLIPTTVFSHTEYSFVGLTEE